MKGATPVPGPIMIRGTVGSGGKRNCDGFFKKTETYKEITFNQSKKPVDQLQTVLHLNSQRRSLKIQCKDLDGRKIFLRQEECRPNYKQI